MTRTNMFRSSRQSFNTLFLIVLIACGLFFASCAIIFPVSSPDISAKEYKVLVSSNSKAAKCYSKGFRGGALTFDILLFWPAVIVDGLGGFYTYYYYDPIYCADHQTEEETYPAIKKKSNKTDDDEYSDDEDSEPDVKKKTKKAHPKEKNVAPAAKAPPKPAKLTNPIYVAILESASGGILEHQEAQFITDVLREEAVRTLSSQSNATIMTRENIITMLPPEKSLEECEGSCLVETGKNISADYVSQARIGKFGKNMTISVELYKTSNSKLISSFNAKAPDIDYLEEAIREKAPQMFDEIISQEMNK